MFLACEYLQEHDNDGLLATERLTTGELRRFALNSVICDSFSAAILFASLTWSTLLFLISLRILRISRLKVCIAFLVALTSLGVDGVLIGITDILALPCD